LQAEEVIATGGGISPAGLLSCCQRLAGMVLCRAADPKPAPDAEEIKPVADKAIKYLRKTPGRGWGMVAEARRPRRHVNSRLHLC
jgi:hypothetical protein